MKRPALDLLVAALVDTLRSLAELELSVCELTILFVAAEASLTPILAHFSLVFISVTNVDDIFQVLFDLL